MAAWATEDSRSETTRGDEAKLRARGPRDAEGRPLDLAGRMFEVTEAKPAELALEETLASLHLAMESAKVATWRSDLRTLRVRFSGWKHVLGRDDGEITLAELWEIVHPDDRDRATEAIGAHIQGFSGIYETRQRMLHVDGTYRWVISRGRVFVDAAGIPSHVLGADVDVTEQRRAEEDLRVLAASLETQVAERTRELASANAGLCLITDNMFDMVSRVTLDGVLEYASPSHERCLGYPPEALLGRSVLELLHPDDHQAVAATIAATIRAHSSGQACFRYRHADGHYVWLETVGRLLFDDDGTPIGAVLNARDVTERKAVEAALEASEIALQRLNAELEARVAARTAELAAANKELEAFSYSVAHDLRTPLRGIDGLGRVLQEDYGDMLGAEGVRYLDRIRAAALHMGHLIDGLLRLSRVQRSALHRSLVDLTEMVRAIVEELQQRSPERVVDVVIAPGVVAYADATLLEAALENLLANAWKYTNRRTAARIEFGVQDRAGVATYFVRDNGAGFDTRYADKLFGTFQRLHARQDFEGTGIGLAIVHRVIGRHGGQVWAEGEVDHGATFWFTLASS